MRLRSFIAWTLATGLVCSAVCAKAPSKSPGAEMPEFFLPLSWETSSTALQHLFPKAAITREGLGSQEKGAREDHRFVLGPVEWKDLGEVIVRITYGDQNGLRAVHIETNESREACYASPSPVRADACRNVYGPHLVRLYDLVERRLTRSLASPPATTAHPEASDQRERRSEWKTGPPHVVLSLSKDEEGFWAIAVLVERS